ncbi:hypothetical protein [Nannocystis radixulma]|uniref:Uncharacterized protein n=1 Tax=Nannocystis radixulma TaxID=2995305 RepID=A0ABT5B6S4_9BACT|nr:hypothetical protein [Nannocystis radixulma]MDC0669811.1 hypothetical protein [Nannocystis radixulma]
MFLALSPACGEKHSLGELTDTTASTGEPPETTGGPSETTGEPTGSAIESTTGEPSTTSETEGDLCAGDELHSWDFFVPPYTWVAGTAHTSCVLVSVEPDDDEPSQIRVELQCDALAEPVRFWIKSGPIPHWEPLIGATLEVDIDDIYGDVTGHDLEWVALRHEGRLVYASVRSETLTPPGAGPDMFAPFTLKKVYGLCPLKATPPLDEGDGFWCAQAAYAELEVTLAGEAPMLLGTGAFTEVTVADGRYAVEVRHASQGQGCVQQWTDSGDTFAFAFAFIPA